VTPPRLACITTREYLAAATVHILREREAKYPAAVTAGKMTPEASATGMELMRCIVAQWRWAIDPAQPDAPAFDYDTGQFGTPNHVLEAELRRVADRARALALRNPVDFATGEMADICEALAWYQHSECGEARIVVQVTAERSRMIKLQAAA
jgi:hypothetical protein